MLLYGRKFGGAATRGPQAVGWHCWRGWASSLPLIDSFSDDYFTLPRPAPPGQAWPDRSPAAPSSGVFRLIGPGNGLLAGLAASGEPGRTAGRTGLCGSSALAARRALPALLSLRWPRATPGWDTREAEWTEWMAAQYQMGF